MPSLEDIRARIDEVRRFLSVALSVANAHTVEFYTHDTWTRLMAVSPEEVLSAVAPQDGHQGATEHRNGKNHKRIGPHGTGACPQERQARLMVWAPLK